jgi:glutamate carboxypeptidase
MSAIPIAYFSEQTEALLATLRQFVEVESPSTDKAAVDRFGALVADRLRTMGADIQIESQTTAGDQVFGRFGPTDTDAKPILILSHLDTVHDLGALAKNPPRVQNGRFYGPGAIDMKASITIVLASIRALIEEGKLPPRPIIALFTSDEETGSDASRALIERLAAQSALTLCMEPALGDGSLKTSRKGIGGFDIVVRGRASHAGTDHEGGVNAIQEMAHQILALQALTDYSRGTTVNVGVVHGGTRSNVIADECRAEVDLRVTTPTGAEAICRTILALQPVNPKATVTITGGLNRPPMPRTAIIGEAYDRARRLGAELGLNFGEGHTGGGSDANFVAPLGVPVLDGLGPMGNGAHSEREHIIIRSLAERAALLTAILSEWP